MCIQFNKKEKNILLIYDSERIEEQVFFDMLKQFSYTIHRVKQKDDYLNCLQNTNIDIALVSVHIQYADPYKLSYEMSVQKQNFPILMISTSADNVDIPRAFAMGVSDILVSPYIKPLISKRIDTYLYLYELETSIKKTNTSDNNSKHTLERLYDQNKTQKKDHRKRYQFTNTNILLVEDNDVNQQLMKNILELSGAKVEIAQNGKEAIEKVQLNINESSNLFDVILMDIQMPEMNGFIATQLIQEFLENNQMSIVPIIAITAHTTTNSREKCLRAGMVDYLPKPIDPERCLDMISQWIHSDKIIIAKDYSKQDTIKPLMSTNNKIPGLNFKTGMKRAAGNETLYKNILMDFYKDYQDVSQKLIQLYETNNIEALRVCAHTLKGLGGNIGADELHKDAIKLEQSLKKNDTNHQKSTLYKMVGTIDKLMDGIKEALPFIKKKNTTVCQENKEKSLKETELFLEKELKCLYEYLNQGRTRALEKYNHLFQQIEEKFADNVDRLKELISYYEFEKAQQIVIQMIEDISGNESNLKSKFL